MRALRSLILMLLFAALTLVSAREVEAAVITYTINDASDLNDFDTPPPNDGLCRTVNNTCTLRAAIQQATKLASGNSFVFDFSGLPAGAQTIKPVSALPAMPFPVTIDGDTANGSLLLSGVNANQSNISGLVFLVGGSTIKNLFIVDFPANGLVFVGGGSNTIEDNFIGLNNFMNDVGNDGFGILIADAGNNMIVSNHIAGNGLASTGGGIQIVGAGGGNTVQNNSIGANPDHDTMAQPFGVSIKGGSDNNLIGGTTTFESNLIVNGTVAGVEISGAGTTQNVVSGNAIGTNSAGFLTIPNGIGVRINDGATGNTVGGTTEGARNTISANTADGVEIISAADNVVSGNYIGTDITGAAVLGNASEGVRITDSPGTTIGGTTAGARNVIGGNQFAGITLSGATTVGTMILGNYLGLGADGSTAVPNKNFSINVGNDVTGTIVGDGTTGGRNVIGKATSGTNVGLRLLSGSETTVQGNYIGTDATGSLARGSGMWGFDIRPGAVATIGGAQAGQSNLLSGNSIGVFFDGGGDGSVVHGNLIGTAADGVTPLPNVTGIVASSGASDISIGGTSSGQGNTIAFNSGAGVRVTDDTTGGISIRGNSIHDSATANSNSLGIDLGTSSVVTENDADDADIGPNGFQNFPEVDLVLDFNQFVLRTLLDSAPNTNYRLDIFQNTVCDPSGNGEGEIFVRSTGFTTNAEGEGGVVSFVEPGFATVTITNDVTGDTSEFSDCIEIPPPFEITPSPTPSPTVNPSATPTATPTEGPTATPAGSPTPTPTFAPPMQGDANCDGVVDADDVTEALAKAADVSDSLCTTGADVNCDGNVDVLDALEIALFLVDLESEPPQDCPPIGQPLV